MTRYLLCASPIPGHVMPLVRIGSDLYGRGHEVAILTGAEYRETITQSGMRALTLPEDARPRRVSNPVRKPSILERWLNGRSEMASVFIEPMTAQYHALQTAIRQEHADVVLCDIAYTGALPLVLKRQRRPWVLVCGVGPLTLSSVNTPPFGMGWQPDKATDYRKMTWVVHNILMAGIQARLNRTLATLDAPRSPAFLTDWPLLADRMLQLTIPALEYPRSDLPTAVTFTGPVIRGEPVIDRSLTERWMRAKGTRRLVLVTQGTWDNEDLDDLIRPTLNGLAGRDDLLVVATTARRHDRTESLIVPGNAVVTDYLPYEQFLPCVDVMVTNGGYGGVHHALTNGVPLVVAGRTADKPEVAARVAYAGVGIDLATSRPEPAAVAEAVQHVLTTRSYREAAQRIRRDLVRCDGFQNIADILDALPRRAFSWSVSAT